MTLDRARYHPSDASRFEEGYVAITRATDETNLYLVDGELDLDDEDDPRAIEPDKTGFDTVVGALSRRSDQQLAVETDPLAVEAAELARANTLQELNDRLRQLDRILAKQPPSAIDEFADARRRIDSLHQRREAMEERKQTWNPRNRRQLTKAFTSLDEAIERANEQIAALEAQQAAHDTFAGEHVPEFEEHRLTALAMSARRLAVRIAAVADPPQVILRLLGERPTTQRERLRWDSAVENVAVYLDERGQSWPAQADSLSEILGERSANPLDRFEQDRVAKAVRNAQHPERDVGQSIAMR